jgi:hypothetical protein
VFAILAVAKAHGLELDVVQADKHDGENYEKLLRVNPLGQVPTFVGADGFVLTECIPIALYCTFFLFCFEQPCREPCLAAAIIRAFLFTLFYRSFCGSTYRLFER